MPLIKCCLFYDYILNILMHNKVPFESSQWHCHRFSVVIISIDSFYFGSFNLKVFTGSILTMVYRTMPLKFAVNTTQNQHVCIP